LEDVKRWYIPKNGNAGSEKKKIRYGPGVEK
jgi:hypothetical protein